MSEAEFVKTVSIGDRQIGDGQPAYIIAEIGINHGGSVELAKEMVAAAWESGADAVKIQSFITRDFLHPSHPSFQNDTNAEIPHEKEQEIWDFAKNMGINLFATPEEFRSLSFIKKQDPLLIKIAAMDFNYKELIQAAASTLKPIILSSGMSYLEDTLRAVRWVKETGNEHIIILHCVSCYPAPPESCNLMSIPFLKQVLDSPIGFSDHTIGIHIPLAAIALGADVIEKHFTLDKTMEGPDHLCSADPDELRTLVRQARELEKAKGVKKKRPSKEEAGPRSFKRRGIYAARDLQAGESISRDRVLFLAPSNKSSNLEIWPRMEGARLLKDVQLASLITLEDIER
jgi:N,N'-diacetyllegionaminate synthase